MSNTIYELSVYDDLYDDMFYYQFKNDDTSARRVKAFLRESLREDKVCYYGNNTRDNIELLYRLKGVNNIEDMIGILGIARTGWDLKEKELL